MNLYEKTFLMLFIMAVVFLARPDAKPVAQIVLIIMVGIFAGGFIASKRGEE